MVHSYNLNKILSPTILILMSFKLIFDVCTCICMHAGMLSLSLSYSFSAVNMNSVYLGTWWSWGNILHSQSNSSKFNLVPGLCVKCFCSPIPKTDFSNVKNRINTATKIECQKKNFEAVIHLRFLCLVKNITAVTHKHRMRDKERDKESNFTLTLQHGGI